MQIAKIVPKVKTAGGGIFDYAIAPEILPQIRTGVLVEVPFSGQKIEGIVVDIRRTSVVPNLKTIIRILDPTPVIDEAHLALSQWMADYYISSLGQTLFENIVPPAIRQIKKESNDLVTSSIKKSHKNNGKQILILADFNHRLRFYLKKISLTLSQNRSVLILVPDLALTEYFNQKIKNLILLHAKLSKTQRWQAWNRIRETATVVVIGSNSALFAPIQNIGLIIVDQIENPTFKNDRAPRFFVPKTAEKLAHLFGADLILGSLNGNIETFFEAKNKKIKILKHQFSKPQIMIADMAGEKGNLSVTMEKEIQKSLDQSEKVLLVLNRKGKDNALIFSTKKLAQILRSLWPKKKIINLEKDGDKMVFDFDIAIATSYALKFRLPRIGLVGIINADAFAYLPDFRSAERDFLDFFKFLKIAGRGIIQTRNPAHYFIKTLAQLDFESYFRKELEVRKKDNFPPFSHLINLIYQNQNESICQKEAEKLLSQLQKMANNHYQILGPAPAFYKKIRNLYRWQIMIKLNNSRPKELDELLKKQKGWKVDVDPLDLM